jgi:translation initiation factor 2 beta subunit (eIF-2beta)/eIF-5
MIVQSKCGFCQCKTFERVHGTLENDREKVWFVRCCECGAVVGVMDIESHLRIVGINENVNNLVGN